MSSFEVEVLGWEMGLRLVFGGGGEGIVSVSVGSVMTSQLCRSTSGFPNGVSASGAEYVSGGIGGSIKSSTSLITVFSESNSIALVSISPYGSYTAAAYLSSAAPN